MIVEVFITDIKKQSQVKIIEKMLQLEFTTLKINFYLDETGLAFPLGHSVLRVEGISINVKKKISLFCNKGILCEIMKNEIYDDNVTL